MNHDTNSIPFSRIVARRRGRGAQQRILGLSGGTGVAGRGEGLRGRSVVEWVGEIGIAAGCGQEGRGRRSRKKRVEG